MDAMCLFFPEFELQRRDRMMVELDYNQVWCKVAASCDGTVQCVLNHPCGAFRLPRVAEQLTSFGKGTIQFVVNENSCAIGMVARCVNDKRQQPVQLAAA
jgi:hypothetical protein